MIRNNPILYSNICSNVSVRISCINSTNMYTALGGITLSANIPQNGLHKPKPKFPTASTHVKN